MHVCSSPQVVSTMMMANAKLRQRLEEQGRPAGHVRCDTWGVCREVWRQDGPGGFWRGEARSFGGDGWGGVDRGLNEALDSRWPSVPAWFLFGSSWCGEQRVRQAPAGA
jgi:hypothetical protein